MIVFMLEFDCDVLRYAYDNLGDHWRMALVWKGKLKLKNWILEGILLTHVEKEMHPTPTSSYKVDALECKANKIKMTIFKL